MDESATGSANVWSESASSALRNSRLLRREERLESVHRARRTHRNDHVDATSGLPDLGDVTWGHFLLYNLLPVTIGNIIGGGIMVGAVYWFVYLRRRPESSP